MERVRKENDQEGILLKELKHQVKQSRLGVENIDAII